MLDWDAISISCTALAPKLVGLSNESIYQKIVWRNDLWCAYLKMSRTGIMLSTRVTSLSKTLEYIYRYSVYL
jgi:hypothetical protein